jgi:hypothetical protein
LRANTLVLEFALNRHHVRIAKNHFRSRGSHLVNEANHTAGSDSPQRPATSLTRHYEMPARRNLQFGQAENFAL